MRHIRIFTALMLCLITLTGCACKHQWADADCLTPKTCTLCEETEGEPAGHIWVDATCDGPKTCSVCAVTEGQPLAHSEAVRDCAIDYKTLTMERQTYCTGCGQILSSEEIILDALHDGEGFFFDSRSFLERYTAIDEKFQFTLSGVDPDFDVVEIKKEANKEILILDCYDQYGYSLRVSFSFCDLVEGSEAHAAPRCARVAINPGISGELGDPDPEGLLDSAQTPEDKAEADKLRDLASEIALNDLMFRNIIVGFMTLDPSLETDSLDKTTWYLLESLLLILDGESPGFIMDGIHYYANENGELVIEAAA